MGWIMINRLSLGARDEPRPRESGERQNGNAARPGLFIIIHGRDGWIGELFRRKRTRRKRSRKSKCQNKRKVPTV